MKKITFYTSVDVHTYQILKQLADKSKTTFEETVMQAINSLIHSQTGHYPWETR